MCVRACVRVQVLQPRSRHRLPPQTGIRVPACKFPSRLHSRCPAMTESPASKPSGGGGGQRARNGLRAEGNGLLKSFGCKHELQPTHHWQPEEEEVRPGMGRERLGSICSADPEDAALQRLAFPIISLLILSSETLLENAHTPSMIRNIPAFEGGKKSHFLVFVSYIGNSKFS